MSLATAIHVGARGAHGTATVLLRYMLTSEPSVALAWMNLATALIHAGRLRSADSSARRKTHL